MGLVNSAFIFCHRVSCERGDFAVTTIIRLLACVSRAELSSHAMCLELSINMIKQSKIFETLYFQATQIWVVGFGEVEGFLSC